MAFCARCGSQYDETAGGCPNCASNPVPAPPAAPVAFTMPKDKGSLMGYGGAALLLIGTFLPALKISTGGLFGSSGNLSVEYSLLGGGPGADLLAKQADSPTSMFMFLGIVLALAGVAAAYLVYKRMWQPLLIAGGVALVAMGYGYFTLTSKIGEAVKAAGDFGSKVSDMIQPGWGWAALAVGAALVLAAGFMGQQQSR